MKSSGNYGKDRKKQEIQEALEGIFAESCLIAHSDEKECEDCFRRARELHEMLLEIAQIYAVAKAWERAGERRAYRACIYVGPDGIRKSRNREWQKVKVEAEAPRPPIKLWYSQLQMILIAWMRNQLMLRIGYHVSITGSMNLAFDRAREIGCTSMQIFLSNPRGWDVKELGEDEIRSFREKGRSFGISPVFAHMTYLPNIASPNQPAYTKSVNALKSALQRCSILDIRHLVMHLGSDLGRGKEAGFDRAVLAIKKIEGYAKRTALLLENEAGQRNSIGSKLDDLVELKKRISRQVSGVDLGFCLDTCHAFEAGYDISKKEVVSEIFDALGKENVRVIHLNDARYELGRGVDRHENIGFGFIGKEGFRTFLNHKAVIGKPLIMETPMRSFGTDREEIDLVKSLIK
jgi:deoxyribonuclease-4